MKKLLQKPAGSYTLFFIGVVLTRLPYLFHGFGRDADSWGVALSARAFHDSGVYQASRFPGFPIHELLSSLTISSGYFLTNLVVALAGSAGILYFVMALRTLRFRYSFLAGAVLAAVPVVYNASVVTHDAMLALAFILGAFYYTVRNRPVAAGIFLGLATGCRITSGAMLLPLAILIAQNDGVAPNVRRILQLAGGTIITAVFAFLPVISEYGFSFFTYEQFPYPTVGTVLFRMFPEAWGLPGMLALVAGTVVMLLPYGKAMRRFLFPRSVNEKHVVAWLIAIDLYIIAFLKLPSEPVYLLPIVPFVILLFGKYLYDKAFLVFSVLLICSPFLGAFVPSSSHASATGDDSTWTVAGGPYRIQWWKGPVPEYEAMRNAEMKSMELLFQRFNSMNGLSLVVAGSRYNQLQFLRTDWLSNDEVTFVDYINEESLARYFGNGYEIYYLPGADDENKMRYGFLITDVYDATVLTY